MVVYCEADRRESDRMIGAIESLFAVAIFTGIILWFGIGLGRDLQGGETRVNQLTVGREDSPINYWGVIFLKMIGLVGGATYTLVCFYVFVAH
jgi:hypothetical protein